MGSPTLFFTARRWWCNYTLCVGWWTRHRIDTGHVNVPCLGFVRWFRKVFSRWKVMSENQESNTWYHFFVPARLLHIAVGGWVDNNIPYDTHHVSLSPPYIIMQWLTYALHHTLTEMRMGGTGRYHWQRMGASETLHTQQFAKYVQGHTHVYSYLAMAPLALKSACFIADFDRQSLVKETQQVRQSKRKNKTPTRNTNCPKEIVKNRGGFETTKWRIHALEKQFFWLPTVNTSKNSDAKYWILHETTTPCMLSKQTKENRNVGPDGFRAGRIFLLSFLC